MRLKFLFAQYGFARHTDNSFLLKRKKNRLTFCRQIYRCGGMTHGVFDNTQIFCIICLFSAANSNEIVNCQN